MASVSAMNTQVGVLNQITNFTKAKVAFAGEQLSKVWAVVSNFFSNLAQSIGQYATVGKNLAVAKFSCLKNSFSALSTQNKLFAGTAATVVVGGLLYLAHKLWNKQCAPVDATAKQVPTDPANPAATV